MSTCIVCGASATREFCYAAEPWVPYCAAHEPQYVTAGERPLPPAPSPGERGDVPRKELAALTFGEAIALIAEQSAQLTAQAHALAALRAECNIAGEQIAQLKQGLIRATHQAQASNDRRNKAEAEVTALRQERDELREHAGNTWDALADFVARNGDQDIPDGATIAEGVRALCRVLNERQAELCDLREGGRYAWKAKAEALASQIRVLTEALRKNQRNEHQRARGRAPMGTAYHHNSEFEECESCRAALAGIDGAKL